MSASENTVVEKLEQTNNILINDIMLILMVIAIYFEKLDQTVGKKQLSCKTKWSKINKPLDT